MRGYDRGGEGINRKIERVVRFGVVAVAIMLVTSVGGAADAFTFALQYLYVYVYNNYSDVERKAYWSILVR